MPGCCRSSHIVWSWTSVIGSSTMSSRKNGKIEQQPPACGSNGSVSGNELS